jgi:predicted GTPase
MASAIVRDSRADLVVFSCSDVPHGEVMHKAFLVTAGGADFLPPGDARTMLPAARPVIAVCAVRTGCGKSQTTRKICEILRHMGKNRWWCDTPCPMATSNGRWCSVAPLSRIFPAPVNH